MVAETGNPTRLPMPTAEPAAAKINPKRELKCSRLALMERPFFLLCYLADASSVRALVSSFCEDSLHKQNKTEIIGQIRHTA